MWYVSNPPRQLINGPYTASAAAVIKYVPINLGVWALCGWLPGMSSTVLTRCQEGRVSAFV